MTIIDGVQYKIGRFGFVYWFSCELNEWYRSQVSPDELKKKTIKQQRIEKVNLEQCHPVLDINGKESTPKAIARAAKKLGTGYRTIAKRLAKVPQALAFSMAKDEFPVYMREQHKLEQQRLRLDSIHSKTNSKKV